MSRNPHANSGSSHWILRTVLLLISVLAFPPFASAQGAAGNGVKGWSYYISLDHQGYTSDPVDACQKTAKNHMNSELVDMRPSIHAAHSSLMYDCKYYNFVRAVGPQEIPPQWYGSTEFYCEYPYEKREPGICVKKPERPAPPPSGGGAPGGGSGGPPGGCGTGAPGGCVGNPVFISSGGKIQTETDFTSNGSWPLRVNRTYRTLRENSVGSQSAGQAWSFSFDRLFYISASSSGRPTTINVIDGDGSYFRFYWDSSQARYQSSFDKKASLEPLDASLTEWTFTHPNGRIDRFKKFYSGDHTFERYLMVSTQTLDGQAAFFTYRPESLNLQTISEGTGRELRLEWTSYAVSSISGPEGSVRYSYDWLEMPGSWTEAPFTKRLIAVEYFDAAGNSVGKKDYHYEDPHNRYLLTGITDENGTRFANFTYDDNGRAILSEHAGGAVRHTFAYPDDKTRVITDPLGTARTFTITDFNAGGVITGQSLPNGTGLSGGAKKLTFSWAMMASQTDFNGNKTCYLNDLDRGVETTRVEGLSDSAPCPYEATEPLSATDSRRITSRWHPDFAAPTAVAEPRRIITHLYNGQRDATGNVVACAGNATLPNGKPIAVICRKTIQPTSDLNGEKGFAAQTAGAPRAWTYTYNGRGQLLTSTGTANSKGRAETEVRTYYEDTTASHSVGDLASITDAAGERTLFLEYTNSGMPARVRRANGQTISLEYGPRQRLVRACQIFCVA